MKIQQMRVNKERVQGHIISAMPQRGYALRTIDETLFIFRETGSSWSRLVRSMLKAFNDNRHIRVVICNMHIT